MCADFVVVETDYSQFFHCCINIKNNVFIDVIVLGEVEENEPKLRELVDAANGTSNEEGERNCHLVTIPAGVLPSDVLISSPILAGDGGVTMGGGGGGGDAFAEYGGIDPNMDPELAMVLRVSMEEERARQERAAAAANEAKEGEESKTEGGGEGGNAAMEDMSDEDALLQQALAMSMAESQPSSEEAAGADTAMDIADDDDDAAMQMALQMSMQTEESSEGATASGGQFQDPAFVSNVSDIGCLPLVPTLKLTINSILTNYSCSTFLVTGKFARSQSR